MKRTPIQRRTPLKRSQEISRQRKPIRRVSKKKARLDRDYARLRGIFFAQPENQTCAVAAAGFVATVRATQIHHMKGRGKYYLAVETWLPVSQDGHHWIHSNPAEARERGWMQSRE